MAAPALTIKVTRVPRWMLNDKGIEIAPKVNDAAESIGRNIEIKVGRGLGAQRNQIERRPGFLEQRVYSSMHHPRRSGISYQKNQTGRFKSLAPRAINKYVTKVVEAEWAASGGALP